MADRLQNKRVLFIGAATGIGRASVRLFAAEEARVVVADRNAGDGQATASEIGGHFVECDITDERSVAALVAAAAEHLGGLDVLVNNAGLQLSGLLTEFSGDRWDDIFAVNCKGMFLACKHEIPHLRQSKRGSIINTASLAGVRGGKGITAYSATKGAVISFTTSLALELATDAIRVNSICPGWVDTPFNGPAINFMGGLAVQAKVVAASVPLGRQAVPEEMAPLFLYLASDESSYMTAQSILIDGGVHN